MESLSVAPTNQNRLATSRVRVKIIRKDHTARVETYTGILHTAGVSEKSRPQAAGSPAYSCSSFK